MHCVAYMPQHFLASWEAKEAGILTARLQVPKLCFCEKLAEMEETKYDSVTTANRDSLQWKCLKEEEQYC